MPFSSMALDFTASTNEGLTTNATTTDEAHHYSNQQEDSSLKDRRILCLHSEPKLGILTQTVVASPLVNLILIANLRNSISYDLAFIGDDFVQIRELHSDGYLYDLIYEQRFGSRIRNAQVIGSLKEYKDDLEFDDSGKSDVDGSFSNSIDESKTPRLRQLPPQSLILHLCNGDIQFMTIQTDHEGKLSILSNRHRFLRPMQKLQAGIYLAVDPSSNYMAIGCSEGAFTICVLNSREILKKQFRLSSKLQFIASELRIFIDGAIVKMDFLHSEVEDSGYVVLLVLTACKGQTRMFFYRWKIGSDLSEIRPHSRWGNTVQNQHKLPLLLIPLRLRTSFILVFENRLSVYQDMLEGSPSISDLEMTIHPPLSCFHGRGTPLWSAWARPPRSPRHVVLRDDIFLIREDGLVAYIEVDAEIEGLIASDNKVGELGGNCGPAVACLGFDGLDRTKSGDMIITGGASCAGGTYLLRAREAIQLHEPIQNWTPAQDFVIVNSHEDSKLSDPESKYDRVATKFSRPDRIFSCIGKGNSSAIAEFRFGLEAKIGLITEYDTAINQSWVLHNLGSSGDDISNETLFLLALDDSSSVLRLASDGSAITELDEDSTKFDLNHRTIAVFQRGEWTIQVTEKSIMVDKESTGRHIYTNKNLLNACQGEEIVGCGSIISHAAIDERFVVFTTFVRPSNLVYVNIFEIDSVQYKSFIEDSPNTVPSLRVVTLKITSNVTSLARCSILGVNYALICERNEEKNVINFLPLDIETRIFPQISHSIISEFKTEAIISTHFQTREYGNFLLLCGTRDGLLVMMELDRQLKIIASRCEQVGVTSVVITRDEHSSYGYFVICDSCLYAIVPRVNSSKFSNINNIFEINRIWLTDALQPGIQQPKINSIASQPPFRLDTKTRDCLLTTGSQIIIASLYANSKMIPRQMKLAGSPTRIMYSNTLKVLITAALIENKSTILLIDPETGNDLSYPIDQNTKKSVDFISGLGHWNERVFRISEWIYVKDGRKWNFIIASTSLGRVLIISVNHLGTIHSEIQNPLFDSGAEKDRSRGRSKISFYTRYKFWAPDPVYSVVGYSEGILWCAGRKLFCDILDLAEKKFKRKAEYELPSPAVNLVYEDGTIYALTSSHSLEILRLVTTDNGTLKIQRTHGDPISRPSLNNIIYNSRYQDPIHIISDKMCKVVGLKPTRNAIMDTLETIFEAQLPHSILRFRYGRCRPLWDPLRTPGKAFDKIPLICENSAEADESTCCMGKSELLGLSITGSLIHFTVLNFLSWKFLRLLTDLALRSPKVCRFTFQDEGDLDLLQQNTKSKFSMHIDGDILKRCLQERLIEDILGVGVVGLNYPIHVDGELLTRTDILPTRLIELLHELHGDLPINAKIDVYIAQVYSDLEYFLRPVI